MSSWRIAMRPPSSDDPDRLLREAFDPDAATVTRVVAGALAATPRRRLVLRIAAPLAAAALLLVCVLFLYRPAPTLADDLRLECIGGVALLQAADGTSWVLSLDSAPEGGQLNLIVVEGERE
jgi:hypothetical protein